MWKYELDGWELSFSYNAARLFLLFSFPCSADHERDWPPCKVVFFGLATNTLNVSNNNNNNNNNQILVLDFGAEEG